MDGAFNTFERMVGSSSKEVQGLYNEVKKYVFSLDDRKHTKNELYLALAILKSSTDTIFELIEEEEKQNVTGYKEYRETRD